MTSLCPVLNESVYFGYHACESEQSNNDLTDVKMYVGNVNALLFRIFFFCSYCLYHQNSLWSDPYKRHIYIHMPSEKRNSSLGMQQLYFSMMLQRLMFKAFR